MTKSKCIFCLTTDHSLFNTKEHIIPESLGSGDWAILPEGLFCDKCQNIFGSSIEQQALDVYPLKQFRTLFSVPTKKGKAPWFKYWEGKLYAGGYPGLLAFDPDPIFEQALKEGRKTMTIVPAMPVKKEMVLRTLLKIGSETFAFDDKKGEIFDSKFDAARNYALTGNKKSDWFYIQHEDHQKMNQYLKQITPKEWSDNFYADVHEEENGLIFLHLKLLYLDFMVPLVEGVEVEEKLKANLKEPTDRLIIV